MVYDYQEILEGHGRDVIVTGLIILTFFVGLRYRLNRLDLLSRKFVEPRVD